MLALNLLPGDVQLLQRGRRRVTHLGFIVIALVVVLCGVGVGVGVWTLLGEDPTEQLRSVEAEVVALRSQYEAQERAELRKREAHDRSVESDVRRERALFAFRLAQCAVPDNATLSAMHLRRGELLWMGASQDAREVADMLSQITRCCAVLQPVMTRMRRDDLHGEMLESFEVRIPIPEQARELLLCHEGLQYG